MVWYGWLGLAVLVLNQALLPWRLEPLARWFTPIMWTGYIVLVDALIHRWRGTSLIHDRPREAAFMAAVSIPLWLVFEAYNLRLANWAYFGLPENPALRLLGYGWSFATITPALFETAALLESITLGGGPARRVPNHSGGTTPRPPNVGSLPAPPPRGCDAPGSPRPPAWVLRASVALGALCLAVPPVLPEAVRPWTFGFVWLGFALLLDPLNYQAGRPAFTAAWTRGDRAFVYRWLLAGLVCGVLWEFWNYWAIGRWEYVGVPAFPEWKLFEMPLAGYLGFPPFALEVFSMYHFVRPLAGWPASGAVRSTP